MGEIRSKTCKGVGITWHESRRSPPPARALARPRLTLACSCAGREAQAAEWRAKQDGSTVHIEVTGEGQSAEALKSYACSPEACALAYRHSQLAVLRVVNDALESRAQ